MRILILHSRYLSGPASGENRVVDDEARLLAGAGHTVRVWAPSVRVDSRADTLRAGVAAVWSKQAAATVRRAVLAFRPDVVHCHNLFPALSPAILRSISPTPVVVTLHSYRLLCLPGTLLRDGRICEDCVGRTPWPGVLHSCYRGSRAASTAIALSLAVHRALDTFARVRLFLPVSRFLREKYIVAGFDQEKMRVKHNFSWEARRRKGPGEYFLYLGRLAKEKGVQTLLETWAGMPARLVVAGDGPESARLRAMAPANVAFLGLIPPERAQELMARARAILFPSICYEGEPRTILEAYAAGVPAVVSRIGGLPEIVRENHSGLVVPPGDVRGWTWAVGELLDDTVSERMGDGAHQTWRERYSPAHALERLESVYREVATL